MKKLQRILAGTGALVLLGLYGSTLFFACSKDPRSGQWLMASLACTILIPVLLYAYMLMYRYLKNRNSGPSSGRLPKSSHEQKGESND